MRCQASPHAVFSVYASGEPSRKTLMIDAQTANVYADKQAAEGAGLSFHSSNGGASLNLNAEYNDWTSNTVTAASTLGLSCSLYGAECNCATFDLSREGQQSEASLESSRTGSSVTSFSKGMFSGTCGTELSATYLPQLRLWGDGIDEVGLKPAGLPRAIPLTDPSVDTDEKEGDDSDVH
jgi:hypothetical protein